MSRPNGCSEAGSLMAAAELSKTEIVNRTITLYDLSEPVTRLQNEECAVRAASPGRP